MGGYSPQVFLIIMGFIFLFGVLAPYTERHKSHVWIVLFSILGAIVYLRVYKILNEFEILMVYAAIVTINRILEYTISYFLYTDPARKTNKLLPGNWNILVVVPVHNEGEGVVDCIRSIQFAGVDLTTAPSIRRPSNTFIFVVDDASTDITKDILRGYPKILDTRTIRLTNNVGKKEALAIGMCGGTNWRAGYILFEKRYGRKPNRTIEDYHNLITCLKTVGCNPQPADFIFHTDSDSIVSNQHFINMIRALLSDNRIGAVSGHCNVRIPKKPTFMTLLQIAWYDFQFRVRKAAESVFGAVVCVSGPGAGFRPNAIYPVLPEWVDDQFGNGRYRGATDRKLTLEILKKGWRVVYCESAKVWTTVPDSFAAAGKQWTRWKQNFWRMLIPVIRYAWRLHPVAAFMIYSRLLITILAPFILTLHLVFALQGEYAATILYLTGIMAMGAISALVYIARNPRYKFYALLRPFISLISTIWGSVLTLRAFMLIMQGSFVWREPTSNQRYLFGWLLLSFELGYMIMVILIAIIISIANQLGY